MPNFSLASLSSFFSYCYAKASVSSIHPREHLFSNTFPLTKFAWVRERKVATVIFFFRKACDFSRAMVDKDMIKALGRFFCPFLLVDSATVY